MIKKTFENRITQESEKTIRELKSLWIKNLDKRNTYNTPDGLFALTLNPNISIDAIQLERDFNSILSHFYKWRLGSKWLSLKGVQNYYKGIIEEQSSKRNHIHMMVFQPNIEELCLFVGYIKKMFQSIYVKASFDISKVYDVDGWESYISPFITKKDKYVAKRRIEEPTIICSNFFEKSYK